MDFYLSQAARPHVPRLRLLERFGSTGLYGEQVLEAYHGRYGQNAVLYAAATELERAAAFVRAMALARKTGSALLAHYATSQKPANSEHARRQSLAKSDDAKKS